MTVSASTASVTYAGNGTTVLFPVPFRFLEAGHLQVRLRTPATGTIVLLTLGSDYTVTGVDDPAGGAVTTTLAPAHGTVLHIIRMTPVTQETDYVPNDPFPAESHERALDKLTMILQSARRDIDENLARTIRVPLGETLQTLPRATGRANKVVGFDSLGQVALFADNSDGIYAIVPVGSRGIQILGSQFKNTFLLEAYEGDDVTAILDEVIASTEPDARTVMLPPGRFYTQTRHLYAGGPGKIIQGAGMGITDLIWGTALGALPASYGIWFRPQDDVTTKAISDISLLTTAFTTGGVWPGTAPITPPEGSLIGYDISPQPGEPGFDQEVWDAALLEKIDDFLPTDYPIAIVYDGRNDDLGERRTTRMKLDNIEFRGVSEIVPGSGGITGVGQSTPNGWANGIRCMNIRDVFVRDCKLLGFKAATPRMAAPYYDTTEAGFHSQFGILAAGTGIQRSGFRVYDNAFNFWEEAASIRDMEGVFFDDNSGSQNRRGLKWHNSHTRTAGGARRNFIACSAGPGLQAVHVAGWNASDNRILAVGAPLDEQFRGIHVLGTQISLRDNTIDNQRFSNAIANLHEPIGPASYEQSQGKAELIEVGAGGTSTTVLDLLNFTYTDAATELRVWICAKTWTGANPDFDNWRELLFTTHWTAVAAPFADGKRRQIQLVTAAAGSYVKVVKVPEAVVGFYLESSNWTHVDSSNKALLCDIGMIADEDTVNGRIGKIRHWSNAEGVRVEGTVDISALSTTADGFLVMDTDPVTGISVMVPDPDDYPDGIPAGSSYDEVLAFINFYSPKTKAGILANGHIVLHTQSRAGTPSDIDIELASTASLLTDLGLATKVGNHPGVPIKPPVHQRIVDRSNNEIEGARLLLRNTANQTITNPGEAVAWQQIVSEEGLELTNNFLFNAERSGHYLIEASAEFTGAGTGPNTYRGFRIERSAVAAAEFGLPQARVSVGNGAVVARASQVCQLARGESLRMFAEHDSTAAVTVVNGVNTFVQVTWVGPLGAYPESG